MSNSILKNGRKFLTIEKLWEKAKLLLTSNFSFSHSVFKRLIMQTRENQGLFGKGLKKKFLFVKNQCSIEKALNGH